MTSQARRKDAESTLFSAYSHDSSAARMLSTVCRRLRCSDTRFLRNIMYPVNANKPNTGQAKCSPIVLRLILRFGIQNP